MTRSFPVTRIAALLAALALSIVIASRYVPFTWIYGDGRFYVNALDTLTTSHTLRQEHYAASWYRDDLGWNADLASDMSNVAVGARGEHWPKHPWLLPVVTWPLYLAFGLAGTVIGNALALVVVAAAAAAWVRRGASVVASLAGAAVFVFAAGPSFYLYDFQIDPLLLALTLVALACPPRVAGPALAFAIVARPTVALVVPAAALEMHAAHGRRGVRDAVLAAVPVFVFAAVLNTLMFGRPWWSGYNRVLVRHDGITAIESHADAFGFDFVAGLRRDVLEAWGLWGRDRVLLLALPGLVVLVRDRARRARTVVALVTLVASVLVFAKYRWTSDRFNWPALALLLPSLAATFDLVVSRIPSRFTDRLERVTRGVALLGRVLPAHPSHIAASVLATVGVLVGVGLVRRAHDARQPWRIESERAVHDADVMLGGQSCDFLAWENMAWECAGIDHGVDERTGWLVPGGTRVGGHAFTPSLRVSTGHRGASRSVTWPSVPTDHAFALDAAVPDHTHGKLDVVVAIDDRFVGRVHLEDDRARVTRCLALPEVFARGVRRLRLTVSTHERRSESVALRGGFVATCESAH